MARRFMDYLTHPPADAGAAPDKVEGFVALAAAEEAATPHPGQVVDVKAGHGRMGLRQTGEALGRFGRLGR